MLMPTRGFAKIFAALACCAGSSTSQATNIINETDLNGSNGFSVYGTAVDQYLGLSVQGVGDVNGDGHPDVAIGAPGAAPGGIPGRGQTYVIFGGATTPPYIRTSDLDGTNGFRLNGSGPTNAAGERFGTSIARSGDLNSDGFRDFIVSAPNHTLDNSTTTPGRVYVLYGHANPWPAVTDLSNTTAPQASIIEPRLPVGFGHAIAANADVDGDGRSDMLLGTPTRQPDGYATLLLGSGSNLGGTIDPFASAPTTIQLFGNSLSNTGAGVAMMGDVNGDGKSDMLIGGGHIAVLVYGHAGFSAANGQPVPQNGGGLPGDTLDFQFTTPSGIDGNPSDCGYFPYALAYLGDINGDGLGDFAIGCGGTPSNRGQIYVVFGRADNAYPADLSTLNGSNGFIIIGDGNFGIGATGSVTRMNDISHDGIDDFAIGAPTAAVGTLTQESSPGEVFILFGRRSWPARVYLANFSANDGLILQGNAPGERFGSSVSNVADFNGDGLPDIIVGAPSYSFNNASAGGRADVFYLPNVTNTNDLIFKNSFE